MFTRILFALLLIIQLALLIIFYPQVNHMFTYEHLSPAVDVSNDQSILLHSNNTFEVPPSVEVTTNKVKKNDCLEIGDFAEKPQAQALAVWLKARGVTGRMDTKVTIGDQSYRVYIGEFNEEEDAIFAQRVIQRRNTDLKNVLIYQSDGKWRVSLKQFTNQDEAQAFKKQIEQIVEGLRIYIDSLQTTHTSTTLRYIQEQQKRLEELATDLNLIKQLKLYSVEIHDCN